MFNGTQNRIDIISSLSFNVQDFDGFGFHNLCTVFGRGDTIQFNILLIEDERNSFIAYISRQIKKSIEMLPPKSPALKEDIPILGDDFMAEFQEGLAKNYVQKASVSQLVGKPSHL